jgi:hypothetical protein
MARITASAGMKTVDHRRFLLDFVVFVPLERSNIMPRSLPFSTTNFFGAWLMTISTCSSSASSSSHGRP